MQAKQQHRVFVYGTLMRREVNHHLLASASFVGEARTVAAFRLFDFGAFPALVAGGSSQVEGELFDLDAGALRELDRLEGHPRFYRRTEIALDDGSTADTYLLDAASLGKAPLIPGGAWRTHPRSDRRFRLTLRDGHTLDGGASELFGLLHARGLGVDEIASLDLLEGE